LAKSALLTLPVSVALDAAGDLFIATATGLFKVTPDAIIRKVPSSVPISSYYYLAADPIRGICYTTSYTIRCISAAGTDSTVAGGLLYSNGIAADNMGNLYISDSGNNQLKQLGSAGTVTAVLAGTAAIQMNLPKNVAVDSGNNLFFSDEASHVVWRLSASGGISVFAGNGSPGFGGDGGPATQANLHSPGGLAVDATGNLYIADTGNQRLRVVNPNGTIRTFAGTGAIGYTGDGGQASSASFQYPSGVAVDSAGYVFIADTFNNRIRQVAPNGTITTVAGSGPAIGQGNGWSGGDNGPAAAAQLFVPWTVAVDRLGNVYIAESGRVRRFKPGGTITSIAGPGSYQSGDGGPATAAGLNAAGLAVDSAGNVYLADGDRVRRIDPAGQISTFAGTGARGFSGDGGPATSAQLHTPFGLALDSAGVLYIADTGNLRIRAVAPGVPCTPMLSATARVVDAGTNNGVLSVMLASPTCTYAVTTDSTWLQVTGGGAGIGGGTVQYSIDPNAGSSARQGMLTVTANGSTAAFTVYQSGPACQFSLSPAVNATDFTAKGDQFVYLAQSPSTCAAWSAASDSSWLILTSIKNPVQICLRQFSA
jgi:sugar lactone lactonase YvrE